MRESDFTFGFWKIGPIVIEIGVLQYIGIGSAVALVIAFLFILLLDHFLYFAIVIPIQIKIICHSIIKLVQKVISRRKNMQQITEGVFASTLKSY